MLVVVAVGNVSAANGPLEEHHLVQNGMVLRRIAGVKRPRERDGSCPTGLVRGDSRQVVGPVLGRLAASGVSRDVCEGRLMRFFFAWVGLVSKTKPQRKTNLITWFLEVE